MEKDNQKNLTFKSTTVGELFDKTVDNYFKDKKYLNGIFTEDDNPWSSPVDSEKEGGIFGTSKQSMGGEWSPFSSSCSSDTNMVSKAHPTQNVSVIKLVENSKKEKRKPHFRF